MKVRGRLLFIVAVLLSGPLDAQTREPLQPAPMGVPGTAAATQPDRVQIPETPGDASAVEALPWEMIPPRHLWGDIDGDGLSDLFVLNLNGNLLFRNLGDGGFKEVTALAFPDGAGEGGSGFFGDYNADKRLDLFLCHGEGFTLYRNEGNLHFSDVTKSLGLPTKLTGARVQLKDYDSDGHEDLMVQTPEGDKIFRNREGREFGEVVIDGPTRRSGRIGPMSPERTPGGPSAPDANSNNKLDPSGMYLNDNSPGSMGVGIPEVEGGNDASTQNDIVDGTVTGADIMNGSVPASKVTGTAATLTGNQNFDKGTLYIDATSNKLAVGTTKPSIGAKLLIESDKSDEYYGCWAKSTNTSARAFFGQATATTGTACGVYGDTEASSGSGVYGRARSSNGTTYGVKGESEADNGRGVYGLASSSTGDTYGVQGHASSDDGSGVYGSSPNKGLEGYCDASAGIGYGVYGETASTGGCGVHGQATAATGTTYGLRGFSESSSGRGVHGSATSLTGTTYGLYGANFSTSGRGVYGIAYGGSGTTYGVFGETYSTSGRGVYGLAGAGTGATYGVRGRSESSSGRGVYGEASSGSGTTYGVYGTSASSGGRGVYGYATSSTSSTTYGVRGDSASTSGRGVYGYANAGSGTTYGIKGGVQSPDGYGAYGHNSSSNTWGALGTPNYGGEFRGNVRIMSLGTGATVIEFGEGLDYAEGFDVADKSRIAAGTVLVIDPSNPGKLAMSADPYDCKVAGIVAGANGLGSGVRLGTEEFDFDVALAGRVYCNVDATQEGIEPGDLLTTSSTPGYAMKADDHLRARGATLGKAMQGLEKGKKGQILVLVTLQ